MPQGKCALCQKTDDLKNSHVIPEFFYVPTYDTKHRATEMRSDREKNTFLQKGYREHLLCGACELLLSKIEGGFKKFWFDGKALPDDMTGKLEAGVWNKAEEAGFFVVPNIDYKQLKLLQLSILWRASIAARDEFDNVKLGPYAEKLRTMLVNDDPGPPDAYPIFGTVIVDENMKVLTQVVTKPQKARLGGHHLYYACYGGVEWMFVVSDHPDFGKPQLSHLPELMPQPGKPLLLAVRRFERTATARIFAEQRAGARS